MTATLTRLAETGKLGQNLKTRPNVHVAVGSRPSVIEPKYDGWRILAHVTENGVHLYSRKGLRYDDRVPHITDELAANFPAGTWLDGEIIAMALDPDCGRVHEWGSVQSVMSSDGVHVGAEHLTYMVFDMLAHGGIDSRPLPLVQRRKLLESCFQNGDFDAVALTVQLPATEESHQGWLDLGFEGSVVKALDAPYASGKRGHGFGRLKPQTTIDAIVIGFVPGKNSNEGLVGALRFGQYDDAGEMVDRGSCAGFDQAERLWITDHIEDLIANRQVIEIAHHGPMADGLRHPQWKRWREDRSADDVVLHDE